MSWTSRGLSAPEGVYKSMISSPTTMCWYRGTGRSSETTTAHPPRTSPIHAPNSSALETVADRAMICTWRGRWMMTSSHTGPRIRSDR